MIRLISGVYGAEDGLKRPKDGPFSLTDNEEARLVSRRVAEYIFTASVSAMRYDEGMTMKQLRGITDYLGLDTSKLRSKRDVVKLLNSHFASAGTDEDPPEEEGEPAKEEGEEETGEADPEAPSLGAEEPTA